MEARRDIHEQHTLEETFKLATVVLASPLEIFVRTIEPHF